MILNYGTDKVIFYSLYDAEHIVKSNHRLHRVPIVVLLRAMFIS